MSVSLISQLRLERYNGFYPFSCHVITLDPLWPYLPAFITLLPESQ